jgi:ATPase subunit of ABC transporter with duplicated ATPase domains
MDNSKFESIANSQLQSLDDTDTHASAWSDALAAAEQSNGIVSWGGRGRGGRGLSRRTVQPLTVVVDDVTLHYVGDADPSLPNKLLLDSATLKLLPGKVYSLVARNGAGKSTLLRRMHAGKIPGFPPHVATIYVPQEVLPQRKLSPLDIILRHHDTYFQSSEAALRAHVEHLENELDSMPADDTDSMEKICEEISVLEEEIQGGRDVQVVQQQAEEALKFFGIDQCMWHIPCERLSGGQRKKISLAACLFCRHDLLLLDEPTNYLDVEGLIQLRRLISSCKKRNTIVLMVSHDVDLINDVATDVIHMHNHTLSYYPGAYGDFVRYRTQMTLHMLRQNAALEKKREHMMQTIDNLKRQPIPRRGGAKKRGKQIDSVKKKLEKQGLEKDERGHRWTAQSAGTGIREGSINSVGASNRTKLSHEKLVKLSGTSIAPVPDKAVQFVFRNTSCSFGEPLIMAIDVGFKYAVADLAPSQSDLDLFAQKKCGYLFDCVDMCIDEGTISCVLGANGSGKTTLLRLLAKQIEPIEGTVHHAQGVCVAYFDQHVADELVESILDGDSPVTPLSLLAKLYPKKTEQELRGELTNFGLDPTQAVTNVEFLSGGERTRLCLSTLMLANPDVLIMDEPTSHLDVESVEALLFGITQWNGTVVMVSHDANLIRSLESRCYVVMDEEGKVRTIPKGIDFYLKSFML